MANNGRISLESDLQNKKFTDAMKVLRQNKERLSAYDSELFQKLEDGYDLVGRELAVSVKQMNHICMVAFEFEKGC